jgi:hypothetical protein
MRSCQKKVPECFLGNEIPAKKKGPWVFTFLWISEFLVKLFDAVTKYKVRELRYRIKTPCVCVCVSHCLKGEQSSSTCVCVCVCYCLKGDQSPSASFHGRGSLTRQSRTD